MKKSKLLWVVLLGLIGVVLLSSLSQQPSRAGTGECKTTWCNDFEFICCGNKIQPISAYSLSRGTQYQCPVSSDYCLVQVPYSSIGTPNFYYTVKNEQCWQFLALDGTYRWKCNNELLAGASPNVVKINAGGWFYANNLIYNYNIPLIKIFSPQLMWCKDAPCPDDTTYGIRGLTVEGADGCGFDPESRVYSDTGSLVSAGTNEYSITNGECYLSAKSERQPCGTNCSECNTHADCALGHSLRYQEKGAECSTGLLKIYGCKPQSAPSEIDRFFNNIFNTKTIGSLNTFNTCGVIDTKPVSCCPNSDSCGTNRFCDLATFTCKETAQCSYDWNCGVVETCDRTTMTLKKPACQSGQCVSSVVRSVECCLTLDCPTNYFCDADKKCKEKTIGKQECPFSCCKGESRYYDKNCERGFCVNNQCEQTPNYCGNGICEKNFGENEFNCPSDCESRSCESKCVLNVLGLVDISDPVCLLNCYIRDLVAWAGKVLAAVLVGVVAALLAFLLLTRTKLVKIKKMRDIQIIALIVFLAVFSIIYLYM